MIDLLRLCRLYYTVPMALTYLLTVYYARGGEAAGRWPGDILSAAALAMVIAGGYVLNDVCDLQFDRLNAPHRALAAGRVGRKAAAAWGAALMVAGLLLAPHGGRLELLAALTAVAAGLIGYDLLSKRIGVGKPLVVAALMTTIYPLALAQAGGASGPRAMSLAVFPAWLFPTALGYELLKDLRDAAGDKQAAARPAPLQRHPALWRRVAAAAVVAPAPLLIVPFFLGCKAIYLGGAVIGIALAVTSAFVPVRRAIRLVYAECFLVAAAAAADVVILGI